MSRPGIRYTLSAVCWLRLQTRVLSGRSLTVARSRILLGYRTVVYCMFGPAVGLSNI
jgi:hypothetical protein